LRREDGFLKKQVKDIREEAKEDSGDFVEKGTIEKRMTDPMPLRVEKALGAGLVGA